MKTKNYLLHLVIFLILFSGISCTSNNKSFILGLSKAEQSGNFELINGTPAGTVAIQRGVISSRFTWNKPEELKPGWYRFRFPATRIYQVIPQRLDENEPFIISVTGTDENKTGSASSYAIKVPGATPLALHALPDPILDPTEVQTWQTCEPLWIGENSSISLDVRRPLLIVGDVSLEKVPARELVQLIFKGDAAYNMFTDDKPVRFHYELRNFSGKEINGTIHFVIKDAVDSSEETQALPVKIEAMGTLSNDWEFTPKYGAYLVTAELTSKKAGLICRQDRNITYSPYIDVNKLPDSWPIAFHITTHQPQMMPPSGIKWIRIWGGWSEMEKEPGKYDWSFMDGHVALAKNNGYRLLWVCTGPPAWTLPDSIRNLPRDQRVYTNEEIDKIRPFLHLFWQRYKDSGTIAAVEIGNEPNAHREWTPQIYARFARNIYEVTHQETNNVKVIGISMSGGTHIEYMEKVLQAGLNKHMDIASLHLYEVAHPAGDRSVESKTRLFMQKLKEYGLGSMPVWDTESGCPMQMRQDGVIVPQEKLNQQILQRKDFDPGIPWRVGKAWRAPYELLGAAWMIRASFQQFTLGVQKNFIFQWDASPHFSWVNDWHPGGNPMPKIIVVATGVMSKMLENYGPQPTAQQPAMKQTEDWLVFGHRYQGTEGIMTIVYVHPAKLYAGSGDKVAALAAGDHESADSLTENALSPWLRNQKPKPVTVQVPVSAGLTQVKVMDMLGRDTKTVPVENGFAEIEATEIPQYVLETRE